MQIKRELEGHSPDRTRRRLNSSSSESSEWSDSQSPEPTKLGKASILGLAGPEVGVEPTTYRLQGGCSDRLSYSGAAVRLRPDMRTRDVRA